MPTAVATPREPGPCGKVVPVETEASGPVSTIPSPATPTKPSQSCAAVILDAVVIDEGLGVLDGRHVATMKELASTS